MFFFLSKQTDSFGDHLDAAGKFLIAKKLLTNREAVSSSCDMKTSRLLVLAFRKGLKLQLGDFSMKTLK